MPDHTSKKSKQRNWPRTIALILLLACVLSYFYVNDYYRSAYKFTEENQPTAYTMSFENDCMAFIPENPTCGFIFYPGGKVQHYAYAPLMDRLAKQGVLCVVPHLTCNLAFLEMNAADAVLADYPEITDWYIGGHSLGGAIAASYVAKHTDTFDGLALLAAYSTSDLTDSGLRVLSTYGSEDKILTMWLYNRFRDKLPADCREEIIQGGCHGQFGDYGRQKGDGYPTISMDQQMDITADMILDMMSVQ